MQFAKNIPKPKLLPPKQVVLGTNRCFGWQVLPGSVKPSNANWRVTRATCFSFEKLADPSSYVWDRHPHLPDSQTWRRAGQVLVTTKTLEDQDSGWSGIQSSWFTLWRWDTQLKGHMRPSDNMKKNTFANYAYESLWIVYSPEDAPVTICQLRLPGLIHNHIFNILQIKSFVLFSHFLIFSGCRWIEHIDFYPCRPDRRLWSGKTWGVRWGYLLIAGRIWEVRLHWEPCEFATSQRPSIVLLREILFFHFFSYFFIFSISQHFSIWCHTKNQHIDLVIQCYSSFHRVNPMGEIPLLIISLVKSAADADRRRERQHLEDVARIAEVKQLLERLAVWRRLGAGVLFGKSVYCLSLSLYIYIKYNNNIYNIYIYIFICIYRYV